MLTKDSGVICVELMKKVQDHGFRIQEVPVHHFHRVYGRSQFFNFPRVARTLLDLSRLWYDLVVRKAHLAEPARVESHARRRATPKAPFADGATEPNRVSREPENYSEAFEGKKVLITGGLGFIGSNLARALVPLGAEVLLVDSLIPDYGGNLYNIHGIESQLKVNVADVRDANGIRYLVGNQDYLFNLAGQVSHIDSIEDPMTDLEINCTSQLSILEACRRVNPRVRIVFASTRQIYGKPVSLPADENHPIHPTDVNGINKASGEMYHQIYHQVHGLLTTSLRLTNTYGPRQLMKHNRQGFAGWFVRQVVMGEDILLFGDGEQKRDFNYVDDVVRAFLIAATAEAAVGETYNLGAKPPTSLKDFPRAPLRGGGQESGLHTRSLSRGASQDRHRGLLYGLQPHRVAFGLVAPDLAARGLVPHRRLLSREHGALPELSETRVAFNDLSLTGRPTEEEVRDAIGRVVDSGWFILGPEVEAFESELARAVGSCHAVGVASGTDAITLALMASGVGAGDEVVTTPLTAVFTALAISRIGARPVFADVEEATLLLSPSSAAARTTERSRALVPVHLYGNACALDELAGLAQERGLALVEDACQAHGATFRGKSLGGFGAAGAFSFYPTKNLGGLGDGGAVVTDDSELAEKGSATS